MINWKLILTSAALVVSANVNAALIDYGNFTTDDVSGLDWLDLSVTNGMSYTLALNMNDGWRLATNTEVEGLFSVAFDGYYDNRMQGSSWTSVGETYADQYEDVIGFHDLFDITYGDANFVYSFGLYLDESSIWRVMGVESYPQSFPDSHVFGMNYYQDMTVHANNGSLDIGVYMVRPTVIPVPAALWLFGSGLIGLVGFMRRK